MSSDTAAMAAVPGESDRWPAAPRSGAAGLRPVPDTQPDTSPPGRAASWPPGQPPAGFGTPAPAGYDGPAPAETGSPLIPPAATAEPAAGPEPEATPAAPWGGPEPYAGPAPPAEPEPEAGLAPWPEPELAHPSQPADQPANGLATAVVPRAAGSLDCPAAAAVAGLTGPVAVTERAVIGDKLRAPGVWCELPPCISRHIDPSALGEADVRERAVRAGWRHDALGRLTCPACQQTDPRFRGTQAVTRWERDAAITMAALMVAGFHESQRGMTAFADQTAVIPVFPDAVIPPGSSQDPGPPVRDAWSPS